MALTGPVRVDVLGWLAALLLPVVLWHQTVTDLAAAFRMDPTYLTGWLPWALMALGLACFVPVIADRVRDPGRRFHGSSRAAWFGWSISLYLLGFLLAFQVARLTHGLSAL
jgi:hypothetical protein